MQIFSLKLRIKIINIRGKIICQNVIFLYLIKNLKIESIFIIFLKAAISTNVQQEFLKHAILDYLVRGTDFFSLRLLN